ncbi:proclotting enzyme-like [Tropilaelaps mercedesae]|uniref:CLIP domain-containing serine protease n=1 Tax=Tropilaelaps mercedesae TaxID=418985 RepID=A0A1V9XLK6_9ACAR|nr:proclotting enzyme-like [Tropilaelaps mercedesae]
MFSRIGAPLLILLAAFDARLPLTAVIANTTESPGDQSDVAGRAIRFGGIVFDEEDTSECWTPQRVKGRCTTLRDCPGLQRIRDLNYLRQHICGYAGVSPLLCCPFQLQVTSRPTDTPRPRPSPTSPPQPVPAGLRARKPNLFPEECGLTNGSFDRIVGGVNAKIGDWPWQALVLMRSSQSNEFDSHCGASLISKKHVLSAAHCFVLRPNKMSDPKMFRVRLGEYDLSRTNEVPSGATIERGVARLIPHERFEFGKNTNDIAIIVMDRDVPFNQYIAPVCLPYSAQIIPDNIVDKYVFVTGWGRTRYLGKTTDILQQASFPVWDSRRCSEIFKRVSINHVDGNLFICAGDETGAQDACQGDSGGPLVRPEGYSPTRFYQVGIVSFGVRCATRGFPGVYTRVTNYLDWINRHVSSN